MCVDPVHANNRLFVTNNGGNNISIVDLTTLTITGTITGNTVGKAFSNPNGIEIDISTNRMFVCNFGSGMLYVLNATTFILVIAIQISTFGNGIVNCVLNPYLPNMLLITNFPGNVIYALNTINYTITNTLSVPNAAPIAFDYKTPRFAAGGFGTNFRIYNALTLALYSDFTISGVACNAGLTFDPYKYNNRVIVCVQGSSISLGGSLGVVNEIIS